MAALNFYLVFIISIVLPFCLGDCDFNTKECDWYPWNPWDLCSNSCGVGTRVRTRPICCDKTLTATECLTACNVPAEASRSSSNCTACPLGTLFRDGKCRCRNGSTFSQEECCGVVVCGVFQALGQCPECSWKGWAGWGGCTEPCGGNGRQTRNRGICCKDLDFSACITKCSKNFLDSQETRVCGQTCYHGGTYVDPECKCPGDFEGKCCENAITSTTSTSPAPTTTTTPTITTTTTPRPTTEQRVCNTRLWQQNVIKDKNVKTSSNGKGKTPAMAQVFCKTRPCGWCPDPSLPVNEQYIEVTLDKPMVIQSIEIHPPEGVTADAEVRNYMTNYTFEYQPVGGDKLITYGTEKSGAIYNLGVRGSSLTVVSTVTEIQRPITQRFRISVVDSLHNACFRFEIMGCEPLCNCENGGSCLSKNTCLCPPPYYGPQCHFIHLPEMGDRLKPLGMWDHQIKDTQLTVSSSSAGHEKDNARYLCCAGEHLGAWCPADNDTSPFYEVSLNKPYLIAMLMFQQPNMEHLWQLPDQYIKTFDLHYHNLEEGNMKIWAKDIDAIQDAKVSFSPVFDPYLFTDVIRIVPVTWEVSPCFRLEIIGYDPSNDIPLMKVPDLVG